MKTTEEPGLDRPISLPLRRPVGTLMMSAGFILGGLWSLLTIPKDFLPDISVPKLSVIAPYQGLPAKEIREMITLPMEEALASLKGLKSLESISRDGLALLELTFPWGTDRAFAGLQTREVIDTAYLTLPSEAEKPQVLPVDPGDLPIIVLGVYPKNGDLSLARRLSDREIRMRLQQIEGVGAIQIRGGLEEEIHLEADPSLLTGKGLSMLDLAEGLSRMNMDYPVGTITEGSVEYLVKVKARAQSLRQLEEIYLPGTSCRLKDVATLSFGTKKQQSFFIGWMREDNNSGKEGVMLLLRRQGGFSPRSMAGNVKAELESIRKSYAEDLDILLLLDRSEVLHRSFKDLAVSLLLGAVIAFIVLLLFIRNHRQAFLVLLSMPASLLWAVLFLRLTGRTLNLMSLGGLALGVGMVVDNAIVVTERLGRSALKDTDRENRTRLLTLEISRITPSLIGSTGTTIVVFAPLLFLSGINGSLFLDLALGVIFSLLSSLIIALTALPVLFLLLYSPSGHHQRRNYFSSFFRKVLRRSLRKPVLVILILSILGISGILAIPFLPREILPPLHEGRLGFRISLPSGTNLQAMKNLAYEVLEDLSTFSYIRDIQLWAGGEGGDPYYLAAIDEGTDILQGSISYPADRDALAVRADFTAAIQPYTGLLHLLPEENILENLLGLRRGSDWAMEGNDPDTVRRLSRKTLDQLSETPGNNEPLPLLVPSEPRTLLKVYPDRQALAALDIELPLLTGQISHALYGSVPTRILMEGRDVDVRLRAGENNRDRREDILTLRIPSPSSSPLRLDSLARLEQEEALPFLYRAHRKDLSILRFPEAPTERQLTVLKKAGAYPVQTSSLRSQATEILLLFSLALLLLYIALGVQFESFLLPLLFMVSIPLSISGVAAALFLNHGSVNLNSSLGLLVLMGLAVNNGILLYEEYTYRLSFPGSKKSGALYRALSDRLRPILMTSFTTIFALLPLAVDPHGTSSQCSLATTVIGGLLVSTITSLFLLPHFFLTGKRKP